MKLKYILAAGIISAASVAQAQEWTADTIGTGMGYSNDGFYNLNATQSGSVANNNWDIAFVTGKVFSTGVMVNHAGNSKSGKLYPISSDAATDFGTDLTADTVGLGPDDELKNSNVNWDDGAFNMDVDAPMSFGWGEYDMATHFITGNKVYALVNNSGAYQVWIEQYQSNSVVADRKWIFHTANLDGTDTASYTFIPEGYGNKLFAYFNISTGEFLNREPDMNNWHLLATKYLDVYPGSPTSGLLSTTGIVSNINVELASATPIMANEADYADYADDYDTVKNVIGGKYKYLEMVGMSGTWKLEDSLSYFIKIKNGTGAGDIWQVYFDYFPESTGAAVDVKIGLQKRKVFTAPLSAGDVKTQLSAVVLAPNPAVSGVTNLVIDAKENVSAAIVTIADISGRVVFKSNTNIKAGLQQLRLDVSQFTPGMYFVNVGAQGWSNTQKLIVK